MHQGFACQLVINGLNNYGNSQMGLLTSVEGWFRVLVRQMENYLVTCYLNSKQAELHASGRNTERSLEPCGPGPNSITGGLIFYQPHCYCRSAGREGLAMCDLTSFPDIVMHTEFENHGPSTSVDTRGELCQYYVL